MGKKRFEWVEYLKDNNCDLSIVPWKNLCAEWSDILKARSELVDKIDFETMETNYIERVVDTHFLLVKDKVPWDKMPKRDFTWDKKFNQEIIKYDFNQYDWGEVMYANPEFIKYCKPETITNPLLVGLIIRRHKQFAKYFSPGMLKKSEKALAVQEKIAGNSSEKKRYKIGDIIEFSFPQKNKMVEPGRRFKGFIINEETGSGYYFEPLYQCITIDELGMNLPVRDNPEQNIKLVERTNKTMMEYFGWDLDSIAKEEFPETVTITFNDEFIAHKDKTSLRHCPKQYWIDYCKRHFNWDYNKEFTLKIDRRESKNHYYCFIEGIEHLCLMSLKEVIK